MKDEGVVKKRLSKPASKQPEKKSMYFSTNRLMNDKSSIKNFIESNSEWQTVDKIIEIIKSTKGYSKSKNKSFKIMHTQDSKKNLRKSLKELTHMSLMQSLSQKISNR